MGFSKDPAVLGSELSTGALLISKRHFSEASVSPRLYEEKRTPLPIFNRATTLAHALIVSPWPSGPGWARRGKQSMGRKFDPSKRVTLPTREGVSARWVITTFYACKDWPCTVCKEMLWKIVTPWVPLEGRKPFLHVNEAFSCEN